MYPFLRDQDIVELSYFEKPTSIQKFAKGEIVLIRSEGEWVLHRVVEEFGQKRVKGDWSTNFDKENVAWARVISEHNSKLLTSAISHFSVKIGSKNPVKRKLFRTLLCFSFLIYKVLRLDK